MSLFPGAAYPFDAFVPLRLPTDSEWAAAYTATQGATAAWEAEQANPTRLSGWPEPRVEDFLPIDAGGEGLVWPPVAA